MRMIRILLSNNTEINIENSETESTPFKTNKGSPQGDAISGVFFTVYFERALGILREKIRSENPNS